jgi:DNA-binding XRE family transcriptional regulator
MIPPISPEVPPAQQICSQCGQIKPLEEFYPRPAPSNPNRRHGQCKACHKIKTRERYVADPEKSRARARDQWAKADEAKRERQRAAKRVAHARKLHRAERTYQPRLRARKNPMLTPEEIRQLALTVNDVTAMAKTLDQGHVMAVIVCVDENLPTSPPSNPGPRNWAVLAPVAAFGIESGSAVGAPRDTEEAREFRTVRYLLHLSQAKLARELGVSTKTVSQWEAGRLMVPRAVRLALRLLIQDILKPL